MSKMMTWMSLMGGVTLLFYFGGVLSNTPTTALLTMVLNPQNLDELPIVTSIVSILGVVASLISVFVARSENSDFYLFGPMVIVLLGFGWDFLAVYQAMGSSSEIGGVVAVLLYGPLMVMYVISVMEWWRGISA